MEHKSTVYSFLSSRGLVPDAAWIDECLSQQRSGLSLQQLQQTALFRILSSDITTSIDKSVNRLPSNVTDPGVSNLAIPGPILVQLLDIEDIGSSTWSQIETIESQERGETTRGNQVIRVIPDEDGEAPTNKSRGPHKVLVEDVAGNKVYAFDMCPIKGIELGCSIGIKLVMKDIQAARGMLLLQPDNVDVLGGKIEAYHNIWQSERKTRLERKISQAQNG